MDESSMSGVIRVAGRAAVAPLFTRAKAWLQQQGVAEEYIVTEGWASYWLYYVCWHNDRSPSIDDVVEALIGLERGLAILIVFDMGGTDLETATGMQRAYEMIKLRHSEFVFLSTDVCDLRSITNSIQPTPRLGGPHGWVHLE
jgi:hypothetical protein